MRRRPLSLAVLIAALSFSALVERGTAPSSADLFHGEWSFSDPDLAGVPEGRGLLAWLAFDGARDRVLAAFGSKDGFGEPFEVSPVPGEFLPPRALASAEGGFWLVWPARVEGRIDLCARHVGPSELGELEWITGDTAPDTEPALALSPAGELVVAWQSLRDGNQEILVARRTTEGWTGPERVTDHPAADIQPALAFDSAGAAWVAWSTWRHGAYANGNYEILARRLGSKDTLLVSRSARADLFPRFLRSGERLALVWTESSFSTRSIQELTTVAYDQWRDKSYRVSWLADGRFGRPQQVALPTDEGLSYEVSDHAVPLAAPGGGAWLVHQTLFDRPKMNASWGLALSRVPPSGAASPLDGTDGVTGPGGFDAAWIGGRLLAVDTASKSAGDGPPVSKKATWLHVRELDPASPRGRRPARPLSGKKLVATAPAAPGLMANEPSRDARTRVDTGARTLTAWFGNLHLHSDLSTDGRGHDGTPVMNYQVVHDLAELDFAGLSDHVEWFTRSDWWTVRKLAELWNRPGHFVTLPGYEWTSFKHGHKNVFFPDTETADEAAAIRSFGRTPDDLFEQLGERPALVIPHHPSHRVNQPTDWGFRSDRFQRLVEIFQIRGSYEFDGAEYQRGADGPNLVPGHSVRDALALGHRLGIIASPDHGGGFGLAGVWAEELTRASIYEALYARRTFGTTGAKLDLWLTVDGAPQGMEIERAEGALSIHAEVTATADGLTLTLVSDGEDLRSFEYDGRRAVLDWVDERPAAEAVRYYYLRARQGDGHLGWTSPVWVDRVD